MSNVTLSVALAVFFLAAPTRAAVIHVRTDGNNANSGATDSAGGAKQTIAGAAAITNPGDIVRVHANLGAGTTYNEQATISRSGSAGNIVTYIADSGVICRGFNFSGVSYARAKGFEITHANTSTPHCFIFSGTCSNIEVLENYAHNYSSQFTRLANGAVASYVTVRGNHVFEGGIGTGGAFLETPDTAVGTSVSGSADHWLVEYNHIQRVGDFINMYGSHHILRNNYLHDFDPAYWSASSFHSDIFQPGSDGFNLDTKHHVVEANFTGDSIDVDSHFGIWQDTVTAGDTNILIRGNVGFNFGSIGIQVISTKDVNTYNQTFYKMVQATSGVNVFTWYTTNGNPPTNGLIANTIVSDDGLATQTILIQAGVNITRSNNLGYQAGTDASYVSTSDPLFTDAANKNFRLQSGSPARGAGMALATVTSSTGSGTAFNVTAGRGKYFCDGFGIAAGDLIRVGSTNATMVRIASISGDTITVDASISWNNGDAVYWNNFGTDIGALPFYSLALTSATLSQNGSDWTVTPDGDMRFAIFYLDGIPYAQVMSTNPRAALTQTMPAGTVTVKTYPLYAQTATEVLATLIPNTQPTGRAIGKRKKGI